jgi:maltose alpha-D-glucosyltransferase/alpha-amylase
VSSQRVPATVHAQRGRDILTVAGLAELHGDALLGYLRAQRWFGLKGTAESARVVDVIRLPWDEFRIGVAIVEVKSASGTALYQVPLALRRVDATELAKAGPAYVVANVESSEGEGALIDATLDPVFQKNLASTFLTPAGFPSEAGGQWVIERVGQKSVAFRPDAEITVGSAEQSNSALVFDRQAFLKLFRRIEPGIHPDVEVTRFLTVDAAFPHVPTLFGVITYGGNARDGGPADGEAGGGSNENTANRTTEGGAVCGMLQEYVAGSTDAWSYILGAAKPGGAHDATRDIEKLGVITRQMHDALAGDAANAAGSAFAPLAAEAVDVERWAQRTKESIREAVALLEKQRVAGKLAKDRAVEAEILVKRRDHYLSWVEEIADLIDSDAGSRIRTHGDYHLGQVLRTPSDSFVIIDFEGEPTRPLAERREKNSPLRDVAGMLRSLSYAAATIVQGAKGEKPDRAKIAEREIIGGRWERDARAAFLRGYTGTMKDDRGLLPTDPKRFDALLSLFEAEKVFYELSYELNHRPGWEWIPMRGISRLLQTRS